MSEKIHVTVTRDSRGYVADSPELSGTPVIGVGLTIEQAVSNFLSQHPDYVGKLAVPQYREMDLITFLKAVGSDADKWTEAFLQIYDVTVAGSFWRGLGLESPVVYSVRELMEGWFANAIEAGREAGRRETRGTFL